MKFEVVPTEALPRRRRFLAEWLFLLAALLGLGGYVAYSQ